MKTVTWDLAGVQLWLARLGGVEEGEWPVLYAQMDTIRKARCDRYRRPADRKRCVLADALARRALSEGTGFAPEDLIFQCQPKGKPYVPGLARHFSLSHSGELVLCAVADSPVGVDIQKERPVSEAMTRHLGRAGYPGGTAEDFYLWWTRQEAAGKRDGTGLSLHPLREDLDFRAGKLEEPDGRYFYCVCGEKGLFFTDDL